MSITREAYDAAVAAKAEAEKTINAFHQEKAAAFKERLRTNPIFTLDELVFSAYARCEACKAGLAYPKECGPGHYWDCSAILMGKIPEAPEHKQYPFAFYDVKSENQPSAGGATTRPKE